MTVSVRETETERQRSQTTILTHIFLTTLILHSWPYVSASLTRDSQPSSAMPTARISSAWPMDRCVCWCLCIYDFITPTHSGCPSGCQPTHLLPLVYTSASCSRNSQLMGLSKVNMRPEERLPSAKENFFLSNHSPLLIDRPFLSPAGGSTVLTKSSRLRGRLCLQLVAVSAEKNLQVARGTSNLKVKKVKLAIVV